MRKLSGIKNKLQDVRGFTPHRASRYFFGLDSFARHTAELCTNAWISFEKTILKKARIRATAADPPCQSRTRRAGLVTGQAPHRASRYFLCRVSFVKKGIKLFSRVFLLLEKTILKKARIRATAADLVRGFTLIEMLVTITLIVIFTATAATYNRSTQQQISLFREQGRIINQVYQARSLAITTYNRPIDNTEVPCGYGIHIDQETPHEVILFRDNPSLDGSCRDYDLYGGAIYDGEEEVFERATLKGVSVSANFSDLLFVPPDPKVYLDSVSQFPAVITLDASRGLSITMSINRFGQIVTE